MAGEVDVEVKGATELRRTLKTAARNVVDLTSTNRTAGDIVKAAAVARAPRLTGVLRSSARLVTTANNARVEFPIIYANPIHWGWPSRNIRANPFATTALDITESQTVGVYQKRVERIIDGVRGA